MPAVDIDVENIPDIIEAQLTLSYSRLSDLIRVIIEQGNGHEDDIAAMKARLDQLQMENNGLRSEVDALKQERSDGDRSAKDAAVQEELAALRHRVQELAEAQETEAAQQRAAHSAHTAVTNALSDDITGTTATVKSMEQTLGKLLSRVQDAERACDLPKAFTDLWAGRPDLIFAMASGDDGNPSKPAHSVSERTEFLHTLPAFVKLHEELDVLRAMINKQTAESLSAAARNSRSNSAAAVAPGHFASSAEVDQLAEAVRLIEQRLVTMEQHGGSKSGGEQAEASGDESRLHELQERLAQVEERLSRLFVAKEGGGDGASAEGLVANAALVDLTFRVRSLEQTVEGYYSREGAGGARGTDNGIVNVVPGNTTPDNAAGGEVSRRGGGGVGSSSSNSSPVGVAPGEPVKEAATSSATQRPPLPARSNSLPPLVGAASPGTGTADRSSPPPRRISQPTVESLRVQEAAAHGTAGPRRRISVAVEPDDGLCRRVAQLEENTAILEVNKADRRELQQLEEALRNLAQQRSTTAAPLAPHRPSSATNNNSYNNANALATTGGITADGFRETSPTKSRPHTASSCAGYMGRPMFVSGSSSVNLRDGNRLTTATISATPPPTNR